MGGIQKTVRRGWEYFRERGLREAARRTVLHFERKISERRYVRRMMPTEEELAAQRKDCAAWAPRFSVIVPLYNTPMDVLREMIDSVRRQSCENWELCLADGSGEDHPEVGAYCRKLAQEDPRIRYRRLDKNMGISGNTNAALEMAEGDYIALFDHDDLLMPCALYEMARAIREQAADFLYSDEMIFESPRITRVVGIRFKPDYTPEDLWTNNYICHLTVFRRSLLEKAGLFRSAYDGSQDHDLVLRLTEAAEKIVHVPKVLYLWRSLPGSVASDIHMKEYAIDAGRRAVEDFLHGRGETEVRVESTEVFPTMYRIREPIRGNPSVRILLTADREGAAAEEKLRRLKAGTSWKNAVWELIPGDRSQGQPSGGKSLSRLLAEAAARAGEDYLLFLDGIPEALTPDWVQEMLMLAQREQIGAVGAKMLFEGRKDLRHAGVILGLGEAGIAGRPYFDRYDDRVGFFGQLAVVRNVSAVTDCWMIRREKFEAAGGFDPAYGDSLFEVDLCLKLLEKGYRNLWTPGAALRGGSAKVYRMDVGMDRASFGADSRIFREKWKDFLAKGDPCYNPNLSLKHEDWRIG